MVQLRPLTRLRIAFVAIAVALLTPLALLVWSAESRLQQQRHLRHQMVAERVFDELEREITLMLEQEAGRPSYATLRQSTRPEAWAPFIVGYFTRSEGRARLLAEADLDPSRRQRLRAALAAWEPQPGSRPAAEHSASSGPAGLDAADLDEAESQKEAAITPAAPQAADQARDTAPPSAGQARSLAPAARRKQASKRRSSPEILRRLNRAQEQRAVTVPRQQQRDPLQDYGY